MNKQNNSSLFFSVSFSKGFVAPNIPIATFKHGDMILNFLLDSGADRNSIDSRMLDSLQHTAAEDNSTITLTGVGGTVDVKNCSLTFKTMEEDKEYTADFLIADLQEPFDQLFQAHGIQLHGILGSKFMRKHHIILDFQNLAAYTSPTALSQNKP